MVPPIMHHFSGSGSIAYGTKSVNKMYQTRYSRSAKPIPSPTKPAKKRKARRQLLNRIDFEDARQTLEIKQQPRARRRPVEIIIGEASPQAQHANPQVGEDAANRPHDGIDGNLLLTKNISFIFMRHMSERGKSHIVLLLQNVNSGENKLEHQIHSIDDDQRFLPLTMRVRQVASLQRCSAKKVA